MEKDKALTNSRTEKGQTQAYGFSHTYAHRDGMCLLLH